MIDEVKEWLNEVNFDTPDSPGYNAALVIIMIILGQYDSPVGLAQKCRLEVWETKQILARLKNHGFLINGKIQLENIPETLDLTFIVELSLMCLTINETIIRRRA